MQSLLGFSRFIDALNERIGRVVAWFILVAVIVSTANAIIRKLFNVSSNSWLELQWLLFGYVFMLCCSWTFLSNEHIRIDIVNARFSKRVRDWIDVFGHIFFLLPLTLIMVIYGIPFFWKSFYPTWEQSMNAGGLIVWPAKLLVPLGFFLLMLQCLSELFKRIAIIRGDMEDPHGNIAGHHAAVEAEAERLLQAAGVKVD